MLEHRCSPRQDVKLEATLHHPRFGNFTCDTQNIGAEGAFVTAPGDKIPKDAVVTLVVQLSAGKTRVAHRLRALVVHNAGGGLGLMFLKPSQSLFSSVKVLSENNPR